MQQQSDIFKALDTNRTNWEENALLLMVNYLAYRYELAIIPINFYSLRVGKYLRQSMTIYS